MLTGLWQFHFVSSDVQKHLQPQPTVTERDLRRGSGFRCMKVPVGNSPLLPEGPGTLLSWTYEPLPFERGGKIPTSAFGHIICPTM